MPQKPGSAVDALLFRILRDPGRGGGGAVDSTEGQNIPHLALKALLALGDDDKSLSDVCFGEITEKVTNAR